MPKGKSYGIGMKGAAPAPVTDALLNENPTEVRVKGGNLASMTSAGKKARPTIHGEIKASKKQGVAGKTQTRILRDQMSLNQKPRQSYVEDDEGRISVGRRLGPGLSDRKKKSVFGY